MHGISENDRSTYGTEIAIMRRMGWSWPELMAAPAALIDELAYRMNQEAHWNLQRQRMNEQMKG